MARQFKVIVADDEKLIANNIARRIEESNGAFRVVFRAGTGTEALEQVRELLPDVVFSDIKMPEMDGIELISRLRKEYPGVCCVIVSGYSDFEYMKAAIQNSAVDYLLKPVNTEELGRLLQRLEAALLAREQQMAPRRESDAASLAESVRVYLQENYDRQVDLSALAESLGVSAPYLSKLFHEQTGTSPMRYLTDLRMSWARKLLADSGLTVREIAVRVGYPDPFHFSRSFRNAVGISPVQFREELAAAGTADKEQDHDGKG
jgi:YesN/AraC family two-component response regulator